MPKGRLSRHDALKKLRHCLEHGVVVPSHHFLNALRDDALSLADCWVVLQKGRIVREAEFDVRRREWRYTIEGEELSGKWIGIVFTFPADDETVLITAFLMKR